MQIFQLMKMIKCLTRAYIYTVLNTHYYVMKGSFINEAKQRFGIVDVYFGKYSFYENAVLALFPNSFFFNFVVL